jgi:hypothetical protein
MVDGIRCSHANLMNRVLVIFTYIFVCNTHRTQRPRDRTRKCAADALDSSPGSGATSQ